MAERLTCVAILWAMAFILCLMGIYCVENPDWRWTRYSIIGLILSLVTASVAYIGQGQF